MIYILQHLYKKEFKNFNTEIIGRKDYLYNIFKLYFIIKKKLIQRWLESFSIL